MQIPIEEWKQLPPKKPVKKEEKPKIPSKKKKKNTNSLYEIIL